MAEPNGGGRLCIVGAGVAGTGAAYALRGADVEVTLLEERGEVGGRTETRRRDGCRYDPGANYVKGDEGTDALLADLGEGGLVDVDEPIWTFDADGRVEEGDRREAHKWTWTEGIAQLAKRLAAGADATVETSTRAASLTRSGAGDGADGGEDGDDGDGAWTVTDADGDGYGPFDAVLLTPPASQTADLLASTTLPGAEGDLGAAESAARSVPYRTIRSIVLHYPFELDVPYYALVNTDRAHDIGWLAREECKRGHVPDGECLLIAQMSPSWSLERYAEPLESVAPEVAAAAADLIGDERLASPDWADDRGWRLALPDDGVDADALDPLADRGLYFAGDWVVGEGRAHRALRNGIEAGARIGDRP